jgi:exportin-7
MTRHYLYFFACLQVYLQLRQQIIVAQPPDKQPHLAACLDKLMTDVGSNLEPKNRYNNN